jgi:hypothetical protein
MNGPAKRVNREELYEAVWSKTIRTLAQEWNTTYLRVVQACEKMDVPRPGQGYWQSIARGHRVEKEPLPARIGNCPEELVLLPQGVREEKSATARKTVDGVKTEREEPDTPKEIGRQQVEEKVATPAPTGQRQDFNLAQEAHRAVLDIIRQATRIDFWREKISTCKYPAELSRWLRLDEGSKITDGKLLSVIKNVREEYRSFTVKVGEAKERHEESDRQLVVEICLREGYEWKDAWEEAWTFAENPNPHCLSDNAMRLFAWAKGPKNTGKMTERRKIGAQAGLPRTYDDIEQHLREIRLKADASVQWKRTPEVGMARCGSGLKRKNWSFTTMAR